MAAAWAEAHRNAGDLAARIQDQDVIVSAGPRLLETPFAELVTAVDTALRSVGTEDDSAGR